MSNDPVSQSDPEPLAIRAVPPLKIAPDLPRPLTSFVGREREIDAVADLLARDDIRLVTLTGPGGVGKTRLALRLAERVGDRFDHVWFVALETVRVAGHVAPAISRAVGILRDSPRPLGEEVALLTRGGSALLILDNMEQVLDTWPLVADLLAACPRLTVLVTSRALLRLSAEHVYPVPPLALPERRGRRDALGSADAIALFVERAAAQDAGFALDDDNIEAVAGICRELDGLPLAIELAAARVRAFSPATIRDRLDARLTLLDAGPRDQPPRLRSMRNSIAWSHDLLDDAERTLFRRLAVFAGPWTLASAEAVAGGGDLMVFEGVAALASDNLVRQVGAVAGESRYAMLETIREFAAERLAESGEETEIRDRHAAHYRAVAHAIAWGWFLDPEAGTAALRRTEAEHADFRASLGWLHRSGENAALVDLAGILVGLWCVCGHAEEGRVWLERALVAEVDTDVATRGLALGALSWVMVQRGASSRGLELAEQGNELLRTDRASMAQILCLAEAGMAARQLGRFDVAFERQGAAMAVLERIDAVSVPEEVTRNWRITLEAGLGHTALTQGDIARAAEQYGRARDLQMAGGHAPGASHIFGNHVVSGLGDVARASGRPGEAMEHYRTSLAQAWRAGDARAVCHTVGGIAGSLAALGRHDEAATLFGVAEAIHETYGYRFDQETMDRQRAFGLPEPWLRAGEPFGAGQPLRDALWDDRPVPMTPILDPEAAAMLWAEGRALGIEEAVAEALAVAPGADSHLSPEGMAGLSPREIAVLRLLVEGRTDSEIAEALFISRRTAATHVRHIYDKLGVSSRAEAAAWAVRQGVA